MSEEIKVKPTPIQRNELDVAMELTQLYYGTHDINSIEEMQSTFVKFYASVGIAENMRFEGRLEFVPKELSEAYKKGR